MKTKQVLEQIELMNDSLVNELNSIVVDMRNKSNKSDVQTIAKHVQELEEKVDKLENYIYAKEKEYYTPVSIIDFILNPKFDTQPQTDYFQKAKNLLIEYAEKTMIKKGLEYTPAGDRFANFRRILGEKRTAIEKLIGYNAKHVQYCFMQNKNASYPADTYKRGNTAIGYIFGFGEKRANWIDSETCELKYNQWISLQPETDEDGEIIEYDSFEEWYKKLTARKQITSGTFQYSNGYIVYNIHENKEYYKQCYIDELLEHWGDVFNYNVLGLAMQNTDKPNSVVPYADRPTQEKEIKIIVDSVKNFTEYNSKLSNDELYFHLLNHIKESNLNYIILLFAKQLERLENQK